MHRAQGRRVAHTLSLLAIVCPCAIALNPSLDLKQYVHTAWKDSARLSEGVIFSIAQTPDGYLWLGTEFGLRRFDGVRAVPWQSLTGDRLPENQVRTLRTARDGRLWIGTESGLASWKDGKLTHYPELDGHEVQALLEDREGTIWAGGWASHAGKLCAIQSGRTQCYGEDGRFGSGVTALYEDGGGTLWAAGETGLWQWNPGRPKFYGMADPAHLIFALIQSDDGGMLLAKHDGMIKLKNGRAEAYSLPGGSSMRPQRLFRDRDGGLWVGAAVDFGLLRIHEGKTDMFAPDEGLSGGSVSCIFEDREGSIWVSTGDGLDRFRDLAVPTFSVQQGLASYGIAAVLAARDGSLWVGTSHGLNRWNKGQITVYRRRSEDGGRAAPPGSGSTAARRALPSTSAREIIDAGLPEDFIATLFQDHAGKIWVGTGAGLSFFESGRFFPVASIPPGIVSSITEDTAGDVWLSHPDGLFRFFRATLVERIPWARLGRKQAANALLHDALQGGLWLGFPDGDVAYLKDGQLRMSYGRAEGLAGGEVYGLSVDRDGAVWAATDGGLSRIQDSRVLTLTSRNGLPCDTVHWIMEDDAHSVWLNLACGLVRIARSELDAWVSHPSQTIRATVFDSSDGVKSHRLHGGYNAVVTKSADGKIWFVPFGGLSLIDPSHLAFNNLPPPVHIESVTVDGKGYDPKHGMRLPARVRNVRIDYTALSLVAPEKVHFKYKLEGQDRDWQEVINDRQAKYTNLPPRKYRFRVIASNNSGVWNQTGDTLEFSIAPAFYQTYWFFAGSVAMLGALLWASYEFRIRQLQRESKKLRDVIETIPAMAWTALPDGSNEFVNQRWAAYTGLSAEETAGSGWAAAVHPDDLQPFWETWRASVASGEPLESEARFRCSATGEYRWLHARGVPLRDKNGKIRRWYGILTDIEDRKRAEEERKKLHQLESDLAHINRVSMMGELSASIAHEINQPLTGIVSNGSACLRWLGLDGPIPGPDATEVREAVRDIVRDGKRAGEIITRIRALTKRAELPREKLDLNETIQEVLALVGDEARKGQVTVRTHFADGVSAVHGDRVQLQQVLLNLVMNAIQAMSSVSDRARELTITTRSIERDQQVEVTIEDSGTGIDSDKIGRIFDAFYTTKSGGMGMGLSICRSILQNHGGRLWATVNEGPGASFHFTLPKDQGEQTAEAAGA